MRKDSLDRVTKALESGPVTINQIMKMTTLSVRTVTQALAELDADRTTEWPARWTKGGSKSHIPNLGESEDQVRLDVIRDKDWPARWNKGRLRFGNDILGLTIETADDPKRLSTDLAYAASVLASMALSIREVQDDPDWFAQISQEHDES